jgi:DNA-binding NtrC family response regulator
MKRILIVDNNQSVPESLAIYLNEFCGYHAEMTDNAGSAYDKIKTKSYDLILIDPSEDEEVRGNKTLSEVLAEDYPSIIRICFTARTTEYIKDNVISERYHEVMHKEDPHELVDLIKTYLLE